jgi:hypothetical protein
MPNRCLTLAVFAIMFAACSSDVRPPAGRGDAMRTLGLEPIASLRDGASALLARPEWLSVDAQGRFLIADISDKNVKVYDPSGLRVGTVGRVGHGPGEFVGLMTAQAYGDSVMAFDLNGARISIFGADGRFRRVLAVSNPNAPRPFLVRVVDDSLFLLVGAVPGSAGRNLLSLVRPDGTPVSSFFNPSSYLGRDPKVIQRTMAIADGADGVVFAALAGGDSVYAFDYSGRRLGSHLIDPQNPLVTTRTLLERNGGRDRRRDGKPVTHGNRNVIGLVALDSSTVAMQVAAYDAEKGTDPLDGGTVVMLSVQADGHLAPIARTETEGALMGRDRQSRLLMLRYATPAADAYRVLRVTTQPIRTAGRVR